MSEIVTGVLALVLVIALFMFIRYWPGDEEW